MNSLLNLRHAAAMLVMSAFFIISCKEDKVDQPMGLMIEVTGSVYDDDGANLPNALVRLNGRQTTSDAQGLFRLEGVPVAEGRNYLQATKDGYFLGGRNFYVEDGSPVRVSLRLVERDLIGTINAAAGGDVQTDGMKIELPAGAIAGGYSGDVMVYGRYMDPSRPETLLEIPGMEAMNLAGEEGILLSFSMGTVELEDASGNRLELADGVNASMTMPVPADMLASAPASIPLWYLDEDQGIWIEEGVAQLQGDDYVGDVSHFSTWNCDDFSCFHYGIVQVVCPQSPLTGLEITLDIQDASFPVSSSVVAADGTIYVALPCFSTIDAFVALPGTEVVVHFIGSFETGGPGDNGMEIDLNTDCPIFTTVSGCAVDGNGNPVTNGYAYLVIDDFRGEVVYLDDNGCFTVTVFDFEGMTEFAQLVVWDLDAFASATIDDIPFNDLVNVLEEPVVIGGGGMTTTPDGRIYVGGSGDTPKFYCLDASNGNEIWSFATVGFFGSGSAVYWNNRVYAATNLGNLYCFNALDGSVLWNIPLDDWVYAPCISDGILYLARLDGDVLAIDALTGDEEWSINTGTGFLNSSPTISGNTLYVGSGTANKLLAIDKTNGNILWDYTTGGEVHSSPSVVGNQVFFASYDQNVYALNATTGALNWNTLVDNYNFFYTSPAVRNGILYIKSENNITAIDISNGNIEWVIQHDSGLPSELHVTDSRLVVFLGESVQEAAVHCFDISNGQQLWEKDVSLKPHDILVVGDVIYHHSDAELETLLARDLNTGNILWTSPVQKDLPGGPVMVDADDNVHYPTISGMRP